MRRRAVACAVLGLFSPCLTGCSDDAASPPESASSSVKPRPKPGGAGGSGSGGAAQGGSGVGGFPTGSGGGAAGAGGPPDDGGVAPQGVACAPVSCAPPVPAGWKGPYALTAAAFDPGAAAGACPGGGAAKRYYANPTGKPAQCSPCSCAAEPACAASLSCFPGSTTCAGASISLGEQGSACFHSFDSTLNNPKALSCEVTTTPSGGCAASGGQQVPSAPWAAMAEVCGLVPIEGACPDGGPCLPPEGSAHTCIAGAGNPGGCPAGWDAFTLQAFEGFVDQRTCNACSCEAINQTCTGGQFHIYDDDACTEAPPAPPAPASLGPADGCKNVTAWFDASTWSVRQTQPPKASTSCVAKGGEPKGGIATTGMAARFCCRAQ
jgi:hypothetical protein